MRPLMCIAVVWFVGPVASALLAGEGPRLDRFGGDLSVQCAATGFFRTERLDGRWWFITPEGSPFFSVGVNVISFNGTPTREGVYHYGAYCQSAYGSRERWAEAQVERCRRWGINTVGCWSDWSLFRGRMPYTVNLNAGVTDWQSGIWKDIFGESFREEVREKALRVAAPLKDDSFLIGYYLGNEMKWGPDHRGGHLLDACIGMAADSAARCALTAFLRERYGSIAALKQDFDTDVQSWDALPSAPPFQVRPTAAATATRLEWAGVVAERFFSVTAEELKAADPNHLNLGVRFISQMVPAPVLRAAGRHVDVMSINVYDIGSYIYLIRALCPDYLSVEGDLEQHYRIGGKPILVTEWGYRAADTGHPNSWPPFYPVFPDQEARAEAYQRFASRILAKPWFVGHHWFQWSDQPPEGRFDGENNSFGLVSQADVPYAPLVERCALMSRAAYARLATPAPVAAGKPVPTTR